MALASFLEIKAAGEDAPFLFGEDLTRPDVGGIDVSSFLECSAFEGALEIFLSMPSGVGERRWQPARFVLRMGKSTPFLFEAARSSKRIDLTLHFFRLPQDRQPMEQNFQYRIRDGLITAIRIVQPDTLDRATASLPERVEIQVTPRIIEIESMTGGTMMDDDSSVLTL